MAKARALDKRRRSIRNIRKITRTMELISRAQFKRAMDRAMATSAYTRRITALVGHLCRTGLEVAHPLLQERRSPPGPCCWCWRPIGGCAGATIRVSCGWPLPAMPSWAGRVPETRLEVSGKRGISAFRFHKIKPQEQFTHFNDRPTFGEVELLANRYLDAFQSGEIDRLDVAYTKFESLSRQYATVETLLPLAGLEGAEEETNGPAAGLQYDFLPSPQSILDEVVPASFKLRLFKCFLDAAVSEQIARMVAMKAATENADEMIGNLSMSYNRARQGQITSELLEIIGGAEALNG